VLFAAARKLGLDGDRGGPSGADVSAARGVADDVAAVPLLEAAGERANDGATADDDPPDATADDDAAADEGSRGVRGGAGRASCEASGASAVEASATEPEDAAGAGRSVCVTRVDDPMLIRALDGRSLPKLGGGDQAAVGRP